MGDTSVHKVKSEYSPKGKMGQKYLASGIHVSMRLWEGERQMVLLEPGDSWVVPKGTLHAYRILEPFTAVEATCPPAVVHGRDET
jgi:hypothetical protein